MIFKHVAVAAVTVIKPPRIVSSESVELRLQPVYDKLKLSVGRLELMTGIAERRFWEPGTRSSAVAAKAGALALEKAGVSREDIGCLIHASVCRDFLEPATAALVHEMLGLPEGCAIFDLSNACLGVLNGMAQIAALIELGQIKYGLVVSGETAEPLHEATVATLLKSKKLTKKFMKAQFASLTIGSAATAVLLRRKENAGDHTLLGGAVCTDSSANRLCLADPEQETPAGPLMQTDSEGLLHAGCALAARTWEKAKNNLGWNNDTAAHLFTHQVGRAHSKLVLDSLGLDSCRDFTTYGFMGNTGSSALPGAWAMGIGDKPLRSGDSVALLGIGSGLSSIMLGLTW